MSSNTTSRSKGAYQIIQSYSEVLAPLANADGPVRVDLEYRGAFQLLHQDGIIEPVERVVDTSEGNTQEYHLWQIRPLYRDMVRDILESQPHLPCGEGHTGWRTVEAGERFECTVCNTVHDRETIEELESNR
jgi:hypothetical protein